MFGKREDSQPLRIPKLRQDLQLKRGPPEHDGSPSWTLYDPVAHKYFKIGWAEFECLARFGRYDSAEDILDAIEEQTPLAIDISFLQELLLFLEANQLLAVEKQEQTQRIQQIHAAGQLSAAKKLLHNYLFFTLPLFQPQKFLDKAIGYFSWAFTRPFWIFVLGVFLYAVFLTFQRFEEFSATFMDYFNLQGAILIGATTIFVKILHEFGHALTATRYGVKVPTMGVAFIVLYPVLYTETTNAWGLENRQHRIFIAMAGVMSEIILATIALIAWHFLPPGALKSMAFFVALVSTAGSFLVNLNPLMRFDGYYIFCDILGIDNMQDKATAWAKWRLRKSVWGWEEEKPEVLPPERQRFLQGFGFALMTYRFFLFIGIAFLVYHMFFQPLGFFLMALELVIFIGLPVLKELRYWWEHREAIIHAGLRSKISLGIFILMLLSLFIPWQGEVRLPAVMHSGKQLNIYAEVPARIEVMNLETGQAVKEGDLLISFSSNELDNKISQLEQNLQNLLEIKRREILQPELYSQRRTIDEEINASRTELKSFHDKKQRLKVYAPFGGIVYVSSGDIHEGRWIDTQTPIGVLISMQKQEITAYANENQQRRLEKTEKGLQGWFIPEFAPLSATKTTFKSIEKSSSKTLARLELASYLGGDIPAAPQENHTATAIAREAIYQVKAVPLMQSETSTEFAVRGVLALHGRSESIFGSFLRKTLTLITAETNL